MLSCQWSFFLVKLQYFRNVVSVMFRRIGVKVRGDIFFTVIGLSHKLLQGFFEFALLNVVVAPFLQPFLPFLLLVLKENQFFLSFFVYIRAKFIDLILNIIKFVIELLIFWIIRLHCLSQLLSFRSYFNLINIFSLLALTVSVWIFSCDSKSFLIASSFVWMHLSLLVAECKGPFWNIFQEIGSSTVFIALIVLKGRVSLFHYDVVLS